MKKCRKTPALLTVALLIAVLLTGCTRLTAAKNDTPSAPSQELGVYVRLARDDVSSVSLQGGSFSKVCQNADGTMLAAGDWLFMGDDIVQLSRQENRSVLFTVQAWAVDDSVLAEGSFLYDTAQGRLYVTVSAEGVTCSTSDAAGAAADVSPVLTLPILEDIDAEVTVGTSGSSLSAVRAAAKLLDWGAGTGLDASEIRDAVSTWLADRNDRLPDLQQKLSLVDSACRTLLTDEAQDLLDSAGCADTEITWGDQLPAAVEAVMQAAGLREDDGTQTASDGDDDGWKAEFEKSLLENYGVRPERYEPLDGGVYQVYVEIDGKLIPYVVVDPATGDYHG